MITHPAAFRVVGDPAPKGSMIPRKLKDGRTVVVEDSKRSGPWRRKVAKAAGVHLPERAGQYQPIKVILVFGVIRPPAQADLWRPTKRATDGHGGDVDKLARCVLDALEDAKVLTDDAQVVTVEASKLYCDDSAWYGDVDHRWRGRPGVYCRVEPLGTVPDELPYEVVLDADERGP